MPADKWQDLIFSFLKSIVMAPVNVSPPSLTPAYPGGYVPNPLIIETLVERNPVTNDIRNKSDINILEDKKYFKLEILAPGFKRENFLVSIDEKCSLSVTAMHTEKERAERERYQKQAFTYEYFNREISLPKNIDTDFVNAEYRSGILSIWFLKTEKYYQKRASLIIVY